MLDGMGQTRVAELKRIHAEGRSAELGGQNPYYGRIVLAAVWRGGGGCSTTCSPNRRRWVARNP
jgi:hypothetical protein